MIASSAINHFFTLPRCGVHKKINVCSAVAPTGRISFAKIPSANSKLGEESSVRRSAGNYQQPPNWDFNQVQSLINEYTAEEYTKLSEVQKKNVKTMLEEEVELLNQLELIDTLQRLGLSYHFEGKNQSILCGICNRNRIEDMPKQQELYARTLEFRLLRQHGFQVSQRANA